MIRAFLAVHLPENILRLVTEFAATLHDLDGAASIRLVKPQAMHLTLAFLGDIAERQIQDVDRAMVSVAPHQGAHRCALTAPGAFPGWRRMRVLHLGIDDPSGKLRALQAGMSQALRAAGFTLEDRAFQPHLTLGRVRRGTSPRDVERFVAALKQVRFQRVDDWVISDVKLMRSVLGAGGPKYTALATYPLGGAS